MRPFLIPILLLILAAPATGQPAPVPMPELARDVEPFPGAAYDPAVPAPESLLGFRPGDRAAFPAEIERCLAVWTKASPRARLHEYARSHEGRALYVVIVSSPENLARIDDVKAGAGRLADPRGLSDADGDALVKSQPAVAWMAYSIHGDETSGSDAALAVLYHLIAGTGDDVARILEEVVVLVDPMQNPDGRHRYLQQVAEHRATAPNVDDQSLIHSGYWPWGRTNHYLFDLNRDWILGVNPESRGRIAAAGGWHPHLMVDAHEMGSQSTYLFSPQRDPRNPHVPPWLPAWSATFAREQARAFDRRGWVYYTGEWNEGWYPGYTDAWGGFRGAVGILYEQASFTEDGVRQANSEVVTYRQAVAQQAISSLANLTTLAENRQAVLADYLAGRRAALSASGPYAGRTFAVLPSANRSRLRAFLDLMDLQGFEVYVTRAETTAGPSVDPFGRRGERTVLPAGTYLIPNRQPEAHLIATMLEFDARMPRGYLERERKSILRDGSSTIYDLTAWNLTMKYGLEALTLESELLHTVAGEPLWLGTRRHGGSASLVVIVLKPGARDSPELRVDQRPGAFAVHDLATGREHTLDVRPDAALVDRSNRLWVGSDNGEWGGSLCVLDLASGEVDLPRDDRGGPNAAVYGFSELPDARVLVFGGMEHRGLRTRYLYEASPQGLERVWPALDPDTGKTLEDAPGPDGPINAILPGQGMLFAVSGNEIFEVDRSLTEWKLIITLPTRRSIRRGSVVGAWLDASTASRYELTLASPDEGWFRLRDGRLVERP